MTKQQAIEELLFQSGRHTDVHNQRWINGFLGMLRPFQGELIEDNFHKIVKAISVLQEEFTKKEVKNKIIASIWGICHLARAWAVYPNGMLQSNNLITKEQVDTIENWIEHISYITFCLLDGVGEIAFEFYDIEYNYD